MIAALLAIALVVALVRIPGMIEDRPLDKARVWQAETPLDQADHPDLDVPVVAGGQYLIPAGADLSVVDAQTEEEIARLSTGLDDVRQATFGAGGTYDVTGTDGRTPQAWRVDAGSATKLQDAEDFLSDALAVPEEYTTLPEGEAVDLGGLAVTRDGAALTARRGDDVVWTARLAGDADAGVRAVAAHGELVVSAGADGWGPYRSWRHPGSRQLTVLSTSSGAVLGTPRVASAEVMHPVGGGPVLVLTSDGADGRTQLVR